MLVICKEDKTFCALESGKDPSSYPERADHYVSRRQWISQRWIIEVFGLDLPATQGTRKILTLSEFNLRCIDSRQDGVLKFFLNIVRTVSVSPPSKASKYMMQIMTEVYVACHEAEVFMFQSGVKLILATHYFF